MKQKSPDLVTLAKAGDSHAFARLYEDIYKDLYRFAFCMIKNTHQAEDIVSDSVLSAYENIHKLRKPESFRSWMFQIVANECKKQFRLQKKNLSIEDEQPFFASHDFSDPTDRIALQQAFGILDENERLIIGLSMYAGYSGREISHYLHKKEGTVRSIKSRALDKMKQFLEVTPND